MSKEVSGAESEYMNIHTPPISVPAMALDRGIKKNKTLQFGQKW